MPQIQSLNYVIDAEFAFGLAEVVFGWGIRHRRNKSGMSLSLGGSGTLHKQLVRNVASATFSFSSSHLVL